MPPAVKQQQRQPLLKTIAGIFGFALLVWISPQFGLAQLENPEDPPAEIPTAEEPTIIGESVTEPEEIIEEEPEVASYEEPSTPPPEARPIRRMLNREIRLDYEAVHRCVVEPFQTVAVEPGSYAVNITFVDSNVSAPDELEIGDLPEGVDIVFEPTRDYIFHPSSDEHETELRITVKPGAQRGSFSIPILYMQRSAYGSTVVCQLNIITL